MFPQKRVRVLSANQEKEIVSMITNNIRIVAKEDGGIVTVKIAITHPSESGIRKDEKGNLVPAHFLTDAFATLNGQKIFELQLGPSLSKNPIISFQIEGKKSDQLHIEFIDSKKEQFIADTKVI
jgi:sulfur-oxidizing protein SoxZ